MSTTKIFYYLSTGLLSLLMLFSAFNYFFNYEAIEGFFRIFGYPTYLIYPLGIAKVLGLIAIWPRLSPLLKEWAYAGFFFDVLLAFAAHYTTDGAIVPSLVGLVLVLVSRFTEARVFASV